MPLHTLLSDRGDSGLRSIARQVQRLINMDKLLFKYLPENLLDHCQTGQITATQLTLFVDSAAWLMPLRFLKADLLKKLKSEPACIYLQDLQFRIQPIEKIQLRETITEVRKISVQNRELLESTAAEVTNPLLKNALMKLAGN